MTPLSCWLLLLIVLVKTGVQTRIPINKRYKQEKRKHCVRFCCDVGVPRFQVGVCRAVQAESSVGVMGQCANWSGSSVEWTGSFRIVQYDPLEALYDNKCEFHWSIVIHAGCSVVLGYWNDGSCLKQSRTEVCTKEKFTAAAAGVNDIQQKKKKTNRIDKDKRLDSNSVYVENTGTVWISCNTVCLIILVSMI